MEICWLQTICAVLKLDRFCVVLTRQLDDILNDRVESHDQLVSVV